MPRLYPLSNNFSAGEWSPKLEGQTGLEKYKNALRQLENYTIQQQGGVIRRPGTRWIAEVVLSTSKVRLIPFIASVSAAYILEVGAGYIRFYKDQQQILSGGFPVEVFHPYLVPDLPDIDTRQSIDVLYFFHPNHPTQRLERYSDTLWRFRPVDFAPPPSFEFGARPVGTLTPSATTGVVVLTASVDSFLPADAPTAPATIGRDVVVTAGTNAGARATITAFTNVLTVTATVKQAFIDLTPTAAGSWKIEGSPLSTVTPSAASPPGAVVTLTTGINSWRGFTGLGDSDCGRFASINGGDFEIVSISDRSIANAIVRGNASGTTAATAGSWSLEEAIWSAANGYGETGTFHEDRLYIGAGFRFAGSKTGDYENFGTGVLDDDAVVFALNSDELNTIRWMMGARRLLIGTSGAEFQAAGSTDAPISPSNVQVTNQGNRGSNGVGPVRVGPVVLFVTRSGTKLRELTYDFYTDTYSAPDLTLLAEHLTNASQTIIEMAYRQEPDSIVWALRSDGVLLGCTYLRDQNVVGWHRHTTDGLFESVATIPTGTSGNETWVVVNRTIGGATRRFIEVLDTTGLCYDGLNTDCTFTCDSAVAVSTFNTPSLVSALLGKTVKIVADGAVYPDQVVTGTGVTISPAAKRIEVGLGYTSTLETMRPEVPAGALTMQPMKKRWFEVFVRLLNTLGVTITGNGGAPIQIPFRTSADAMGNPPALFTGDKKLAVMGWSDESTITIQQTQPLPSNILLISGLMDVGS